MDQIMPSFNVNNCRVVSDVNFFFFVNPTVSANAMQIEEMGGSALVCAGDMSKEADVEALFKAVSFTFPSISRYAN